MKIFISIASYQDPLLKNTIQDAFNKAQNKSALVFGICDQSNREISLDDLEFKEQIRYEHVEALLSRGPCWARARIQALFNNEDFYLQIDSHTLFDENWDQKLIDALLTIEKRGNISSYHKKPFITGYPRGFGFNETLQKYEKESSDKNVQPIGYRKDSLFLRGRFSRQIGLVTNIHDFTHGYLLAAGCLFSRGSLVKEIPYDHNYYFYGEEISLMLRLFTNGYSAFHMADMPVFHLYTNHETIDRPLHWSPEEDKDRIIKWHQLEEKSILRLDELVKGAKLEGFGLGNKRSLNEYKTLSGVDLVEKKVVDEDRSTTSKFFEEVNWKDGPL